MRRITPLIIAFCALLWSVSCEEDTGNEGVLAIVDGVEITEEDAWEHMGADPGTIIPPRIVDELIDNELILREARELDLGDRVGERDVENYYQALAATDEVILAGGTAAKRREQLLRERIKNELTRDAVLEVEVFSRIEISPQQIEEYYAEHREEFTNHPVSFRQIVLPDETAAEEAARRLAEGEDFAELAAELGTTEEAERGGLLELSNREDLPVDLLEALEELEENGPGTLSDPVETDWGWHLLMLESGGEPSVQPLDVVDEEIRNILFEQQSARELESWLQGLRAAADELIWRAPVEEDE